MKKFFRIFVYDNIPYRLKKLVKKIYLLIFKTHTFKQNEHYLFSDEKLKFVHILESFNYQKVAGNNGITIPKLTMNLDVIQEELFALQLMLQNF